MFSTTLAAAAVGGLLVSGSLAVPPAWQPDYRTALVQSAQQHKPVAVFIAPGGQSKLVQDGKIGLEVNALLRQSYVCLSVDTRTESGKVLAGAFGLSDEGLVISDKNGSLQALRHAGTVSPADLSKYLKAYSSGDAPVSTEVAGTAVAPSTTSIQGYAQPYRVCGPNGCSYVYPAGYSQPAYQPSTGPVRQVIGNTVGTVRQLMGGMTGTCASGNCPYR